jgi:hypothetical protein
MLTVTDAAGLTATSTQTIEVGHSITVAGVSWASDPPRLKVSGSGFEAGSEVRIDGAAAPQTKFKSSSLVVAKGSALKSMAPKGVSVQVTAVAPDGRTSAPFAFIR